MRIWAGRHPKERFCRSLGGIASTHRSPQGAYAERNMIIRSSRNWSAIDWRGNTFSRRKSFDRIGGDDLLPDNPRPVSRSFKSREREFRSTARSMVVSESHITPVSTRERRSRVVKATEFQVTFGLNLPYCPAT